MFKSLKFNKKIVKTVLYLFLILLFIYACKTASNAIGDRMYISELKKNYPDLSDYIDKAAEMSDKERKGLLLMVGIKDKVLSEETIKTLKDNHIMGVILFDYNITDIRFKKIC